MLETLDDLYRESEGFRVLKDAIGDDRGAMIDLALIYDATAEDDDEGDRPTPAEWYDGDEEGVHRRADGTIRAGWHPALMYLAQCDHRASKVMGRMIADAMKADRAGSAMRGGPFAAMFAKLAVMEGGGSERDASAEIVAEAMERTDHLSPEDQGRAVAELRRNLDGFRLEILEDGE